MKKTTSSRKKRSKSSKNIEIDSEAVKILRIVPDNEAFYFYEAIGKPTGETARNLFDFLDKVKSIKQESLMFHQQRRDFQNWVEKILGDPKLAGKLGEIPSSASDDVRRSICKTVENRIKELRESSSAILVEQNSIVLQSSS